MVAEKAPGQAALEWRADAQVEACACSRLALPAVQTGDAELTIALAERGARARQEGVLRQGAAQHDARPIAKDSFAAVAGGGARLARARCARLYLHALQRLPAVRLNAPTQRHRGRYLDHLTSLHLHLTGLVGPHGDRLLVARQQAQARQRHTWWRHANAILTRQQPNLDATALIHGGRGVEGRWHAVGGIVQIARGKAHR